MSKNVNISELSAQQQQVIELMIAGNSQGAIAEQLDIARETISRWKSSDAEFVAALNQAKLAQWDAFQSSIQALAADTHHTLKALLKSDDEKIRLQTCKLLLDRIGQPGGPTDAEKVQRLWAFENMALFS